MSFQRIIRFLLVGLSNTLIDFGITNALVIFFKPSNYLNLMAISLIACLTAMFFSYFMNRNWTFQKAKDNSSRKKEIFLFFAFSFFSMIINTSVFLFSVKYLTDIFKLQGLLLINISKLLGVLCGASVGFISYAFIVFRSANIVEFKKNFSFLNTETQHLSFLKQIGVLIALAIVVRGVFLFITQSITGDAITYSSIANNLASGNFKSIDAFWINLFCYWQALFILLKFSPMTAIVLSTFIPGVLLLIPVVWVTRALYNVNVAWVAGILCVTHPRLVSYSINGYPEMFYIFALTCGIAYLTKTILTPKKLWASLGWGVSFGIYVAVRNEGILLYIMSLTIPLSIYWLHSRNLNNKESSSHLCLNDVLKSTGVSVIGFVLIMTLYVTLCQDTLHTSGLFLKSSNLVKNYSEQLDFEKSAKEIYSEDRGAQKVVISETSLKHIFSTLIKRFQRNVLYELQRMPGVLLSPLYILVLVLLAVSQRNKLVWGAKLPLIYMLLFPLFFYPLIQLEPRLLFSIIVPLNIFCAAGILVFYFLLIHLGANRSTAKIIFLSVIILNVILNIFTLIVLGVRLEKENQIHRQLADWIDKNVNADDVLTGDGYGYIQKTGFLAKHETISRVWTENPDQLVDFVRENKAHWLLLYEPFLEKGNHALLPLLNTGVPGAEKVYEIKDEEGKRYQIYHVK